MPKKLSQEDKDRIKKLLQEGKKSEEIAEETGISISTIKRIRKVNSDTIPKTKKQETAPVEHPIDKGLKKRSEQKIVEYSSDVILQDFKLEMKTARVLHKKELQYRQEVENMGLTWEQFIEAAIDSGINLARQANEELKLEVTVDDLQKAVILKNVDKQLGGE